MPSQNGRDLLLKIGDGAAPEVFTALGCARTTSLSIDNRPADATALDSAGMRSLQAQAGVQAMEITLEGLFRDAAAEETLRLAAFDRTLCNYKLVFPNGDVYAAAFVVSAYSRGGSFDGLESFSATFQRSGAGVFTAGG